jgi:hypothetical protein
MDADQQRKELCASSVDHFKAELMKFFENSDKLALSEQAKESTIEKMFQQTKTTV